MKIILLAILPNWNSLDSVRQAHSDLELAGLVFFALLVVAEALAHNSKQEERKHLFDSIGIWFFAIAILCEIAGYWYGQRNDALSEKVIVSLDAKAREAGITASTALGKSKEADAKSNDALNKAATAQGKADAAGTASQKAIGESTYAKALVDDVEKKADDLTQKYLAAEKDVSKEHGERMELEHAVAPRRIWNMKIGDEWNLAPLAKYKDMSVRIETISDWEARRAAANLRQIFNAAGWRLSGPIKVLKDDPTVDPKSEIFDGVTVERFQAGGPKGDATWGEIQQQWANAEVQEAIITFLEANAWEAHWGVDVDRELKANEIKLLVGFKPTSYFFPKVMKDAFREADENRKQMEKKLQQEREKQREREREMFPQLTPK